jgi:hypothetical protein
MVERQGERARGASIEWIIDKSHRAPPKLRIYMKEAVEIPAIEPAQVHEVGFQDIAARS